MMQPYAWLFSKGILTVDDRSWSTSYRGLLAIHASKQFHLQYYEFLKRHTQIALPEIDAFEHGGFVAAVDLVDCLPPNGPKGSPNGRPQLHRSHFGVSGYYGLVFENPQPFAFTPARGNRGLYEIALKVLPLAQDKP